MGPPKRPNCEAVPVLLQIGKDCNGDEWNVGPGVREGSRGQKRFREGNETIEDEPRSGRPSTSRTPEVIEKVRQMLAQDRRLTLRLIAEELVISKDTVHTIVRDVLGKRKICSRFVPHKLTDEQKAKRMETSGDFISMCDQDPLVLKTIVTGDETWCYQFDPESKRQSMSWCSRPMQFEMLANKETNARVSGLLRFRFAYRSPPNLDPVDMWSFVVGGSAMHHGLSTGLMGKGMMDRGEAYAKRKRNARLRSRKFEETGAIFMDYEKMYAYRTLISIMSISITEGNYLFTLSIFIKFQMKLQCFLVVLKIMVEKEPMKSYPF
ncbi:hypothetical protein ANN_16817 [Periplaneta americana]|uniref:Transposase n=1 Tax=Periplaneta americana TaxID=6978 RepID=A0ABQ8SSF2_PERAM|nr:hypothetical protein ANN_16817 [Periplaneta americana]